MDIDYAAGSITYTLADAVIGFIRAQGRPQVGLYPSILPLIACVIFGTSQALAVGQVATPGNADNLAAALSPTVTFWLLGSMTLDLWRIIA